jgi:hypothetical protein
MARPSFDSTISVGDVLQVLTILGALALGFNSIRERLTVLEVRISPLWDEFIATRRIVPASSHPTPYVPPAPPAPAP